MSSVKVFLVFILASFLGCDQGAKVYPLPENIRIVRIEVSGNRPRVEIRPSSKRGFVSVEGGAIVDSTSTLEPHKIWDLDPNFDPYARRTLMIRDWGSNDEKLVITLDSSVIVLLAIVGAHDVSIGDWGGDITVLSSTKKDSVRVNLGRVSGRLDFLNCRGKTRVFCSATDSLNAEVISGDVSMSLPEVNSGYLFSRSDGGGNQIHLEIGTAQEFQVDMDFPADNSGQEVEIHVSKPIPDFGILNYQYECCKPTIRLRREQQPDSSIVFTSEPQPPDSSLHSISKL